MIKFVLRTKLSFRQNSDYLSVRLANNEQPLKNHTDSPLTHGCNVLLAFQSSKLTSLFSSVFSIGGKVLEQFTTTTTTTTTNFIRINVFPATEQHAKRNQTRTRSTDGNCFFIYTDIGLSDTQALDGYFLKTMKWKLEKKCIRHLV